MKYNLQIHICFNMFKTKNWNYKQDLNWLQNLKSKQVCTKTIKLVRQMSVSIDCTLHDNNPIKA